MGSRKCVKVCRRLELRDTIPLNYVGTKEHLYLGHGLHVMAKVISVRWSEVLNTHIVEFEWEQKTGK